MKKAVYGARDFAYGLPWRAHAYLKTTTASLEVATTMLASPPLPSPAFAFLEKENDFEMVGVPAPAPARGAGPARVGGALVF